MKTNWESGRVLSVNIQGKDIPLAGAKITNGVEITPYEENIFLAAHFSRRAWDALKDCDYGLSREFLKLQREYLEKARGSL